MFIEPRTSQRPALWVGGGSQLADPKSPDLPKFVESVKARTLRADGWIPRPTCPPPDIARDWNELQAYFGEHGQDASELSIAHENFLHLVLTNDPAKAREEQHRAFLKVMSGERGPNYLESVYLFGTPDEIVASLQARVDAGVEHFILHTMTPGSGAAPAVGRRDHPERHVPADGRAGAPSEPQRRGRRGGVVTRRVALLGKPLKRRHSVVMHNAAFEAAGIDARYELLELEPDDVEAGRDGRARAGVPRARRDRAVQEGRREPRRRGRARRGTDRGGQQRRPHRRRPADRHQHRRAGVPGRASSWRWAGR